MPSMPHEAPLFLFRERPELAAELLRDALGVAVPAHDRARVEEADFTQLVPSAYHADLVISLANDDGPVMGIVVEVQLAPKPEKRFSWPLYVAALHAKIRCPTCLIVLVETEEMARWARQPIVTFQPGCGFTPTVLGPSGVPLVTSVEEAMRSPEAAVLSALAHGSGARGADVGLAALIAIRGLLDDRLRKLYSDLVLSALVADARAALEIAMLSRQEFFDAYEFKSDFMRRQLAKAAEPLAREMAEPLAREMAEPLARDRAEQLAREMAEPLARDRAEQLAREMAEPLARELAEPLAERIVQKTILALFARRGLAVSEPLRAEILACGDIEVLARWLLRAATVERAEDTLLP